MLERWRSARCDELDERFSAPVAVWIIGITAVAAPVAVARYRRV